MTKRKIARLDLKKDFSSFAELLQLCYGPQANTTLQMYCWYLEDNPYNPNGHLLYVLKEGDRIIAADGLSPVELYLQGKVVPAAFSVRSMTHPDYRRQGIFTLMTENSLEKGREAGIDLVLGLANEASYRAYQIFKWSTLFEKEVYAKPVAINNLLHRRIPIKPLVQAANYCFNLYQQYQLTKMKHFINPGYTLEILDHLPETLQHCWDSYKASYSVLLVRDYNYLNYRYNLRPDTAYQTLVLKRGAEIIGYMVTRLSVVNKMKLVSVLELFTEPHNKEFISTLIYHLVQYGIKNKTDYLVVSSGLYGKYKETLNAFGFMVTPKKPRNNMMIAKPLTGKATIDEIDDYNKWHLSQGDGETDLDF